MSAFRVSLALLTIAAGITAQFRQPLSRRISYGAEATSFGELLIPAGAGPFPVAVLIHGGCWLASFGSTASYQPIAEMLEGHGIATWNVEYRRVGHAGGGWPGSFRDLSDAVDHLRVLADAYPIDTTRIIAIGHSSGGYFAAWLATRTQLPASTPLAGAQPLPIAGLVITDAFLDPLVVDSRGIDGQLYCGEPILERLVGGDPNKETDQLQQISPLQMLPWGVPQEYVVSSRRYPVVPPRPLADGRTTMQVPDYPALARKAGDDVVVQVIPEAGHLDFYEPTSEAGLAVERALLRVFGSIEK